MPILATNLVTNDINLIICACQLRAERANGRPIAEVVRYNAGLAYIVSEPQAGINTSLYNFDIRPAFGQSPSAPGYAVTSGSFPSTFVAELGRA